MIVRITYKDNTTREVELADVMFGDEEVEARGPILFATPVKREDRSPDHAFPSHNGLSRSATR